MSGAIVFSVGSTLQTEFARLIQPKNMNGTVPEMTLMNFPTTQRVQDVVMLINDIKELIGRLAVFFIHDVQGP